MKALELLPAIGKGRLSPEVHAVLTRIGAPGDFHGEHPRGYAEFRSLGICLVFEIEEDHEVFPDSWTTLSIMFIGTKEDGYDPFQGELPERLEFGEEESSVRARLGKPTEQGGGVYEELLGTVINPWIRYLRQGYELHCEFDPSVGLKRVSIQ